MKPIKLSILGTEVNIYFSLVLFATIIIALGYAEQFFILAVFVTIHELGHVLAAKLAARAESKTCALKAFSFMPLGEVAVLTNLERLSGKSRACVYLAGPAANLICALLFKNGETVFYTNLALCLINLLPAFPFDGGRLWQLILGDALGVVNANKIIITLTKLLSFLLLFVGAIQIALFPYNCSLILLGFFIRRNASEQVARNMADFYRYAVSDRVKFEHRKNLKSRVIRVKMDDPAFQVFKALSYDYAHEIYIEDMGVNMREECFCEVVQKSGMNRSVGRMYINSRLNEHKLE